MNSFCQNAMNSKGKMGQMLFSRPNAKRAPVVTRDEEREKEIPVVRLDGTAHIVRKGKLFHSLRQVFFIFGF